MNLPVPRWRHLPAVLGLLLAATVLWHLYAWGIRDAVWAPDADACRALSHQGACWGVVAEKAWPMLMGHPADTGLSGLPLTLALFAGSLLASWPLGLGLALARHSGPVWLKVPAVACIEVIRGVPLVTLLFMAAFMLPLVLPEAWQLDLGWRAGIALTLFSAVYLAEVLRGGLQTVPAEQTEAAAILGLSWPGIQRRIVLPQAVRAVLPALTSHAIGLLKDSSLVMVIGLHELTGGLSLSLGGDPEWRPYYFEAYLFVGLVYALMCWGLSALGRGLEKRWMAGAH